MTRDDGVTGLTHKVTVDGVTMTLDSVLSDLVASIYPEVDKELGRLVQLSAKKGRPVSCTTCREGHCCKIRTTIPFFQGLILAKWLRDNGMDTPEVRYDLLVRGRQMEGSGKHEFYEQKIPCFFLKDNMCSVYPIRPIMCRSYFVVTPKERCGGPAGNIVGQLNLNELLGTDAVNAREIHTSLLGLKDNNMRVMIGVLPRMVLLGLECLDRPDWREHVRRQPWPTLENGDRWLNGDNEFAEFGFGHAVEDEFFGKEVPFDEMNPSDPGPPCDDCGSPSATGCACG